MVRVDIGAGALDVWVESSGTKLEEHRLQALDAQAKQECHVASVADEVTSQYDPSMPCPLMRSCLFG